MSERLEDWRAVRRYAVPGWMIAECAEAREREDWRAACEAARVDVRVGDPGPVAGLLAGFAPDLLRWHLPRALNGTAALAQRMRFLLTPDGPVTADTVVLQVRSPRWVSGAQRLTLLSGRLGDLGPGPVFPVAPHLWDARRAAELTAGTPTWASTGWQVPAAVPAPGEDLLGPADPVVAARELRRVTAQFRRWSWRLWPEGIRSAYRRPDRHVRLEIGDGRLRVVLRADEPSQPAPTRADLCLHRQLLRSPVDLDLVRLGHLDAGEVHPLVRAALFPGAGGSGAGGSLVPDGFGDEEMLRIHCAGQWHRIRLRGGRLELLHHTVAEKERELALGAFGGVINACFRVDRAWRRGEGALPKRLRAYRRDLWRRMEHGGGRVVLALLDAGLDPGFRDGQGRTLLHRIHQFEHAELLPRLLAEGLDVNDRGRYGHPPMFETLIHTPSHDLLRALTEAGAWPPLSLPVPSIGP
ncbi:hypothetical protein GCM10010112_75160 [Actinoplanes lobatus]|uniref:Ankyrin repeat protein n=1 Tax=Actinoplanes lobatus TaxID=113568 RepID=A0A7W7MHF8_9ACTN|nr:hypothetical protein [Actinoplanes lobatus]MBB4750467.1 hypothetical protein [Actinoplanes lobatus]GGN90080.1 hypothetical protein GCM10010112_75160 [Actinoplanes lobatus]GIE43856.1 hypothetical protein Alo02nite_67540 [Actinoplanes lobatus]